MSIDGIAREIARTAALPLPLAQTLPAAAYTSEEYFAHEAGALLRAGWLCAAHISQLKNPGAMLAIDFLEEPVLLVRGEDDLIRAFSRVCPHRAADILLQGENADCSKRPSVITCPYHRWSFGLDGNLLGAPEMQQVENFNLHDWRLTTIRSAVWQGFIFVNLDGQAPSLEQEYAQFAQTVAPWNLAALELVISRDWECAFNWKVMVENWIESYHHLGPHSKTLNRFMPAQDTWSEMPHPAFIHAHLPLTGRAAAEDLAAIENGARGSGFLPLPGLSQAQEREWNLFVGFPCFMLLLARDRAIWYRLQPISAERCRLTTTTLVARDNLSDSDYSSTLQAETQMLMDFHLEDMAINAAVQRGLRSAHAMRGRLSHLEEPVWQFQRQLAAHMAA